MLGSHLTRTQRESPALLLSQAYLPSQLQQAHHQTRRGCRDNRQPIPTRVPPSFLLASLQSLLPLQSPLQEHQANRHLSKALRQQSQLYLLSQRLLRLSRHRLSLLQHSPQRHQRLNSSHHHNHSSQLSSKNRSQHSSQRRSHQRRLKPVLKLNLRLKHKIGLLAHSHQVRNLSSNRQQRHQGLSLCKRKTPHLQSRRMAQQHPRVNLCPRRSLQLRFQELQASYIWSTKPNQTLREVSTA